MYKNPNVISIFFLFVFFSFSASGQDIHYSQYFHSPLNLSPAQTGIFNGDTRIGVNYKHQWYPDDLVEYLTFTGYFDKKFYSAENDNGFWTGGLLFNYDQAGDSRLRLIQLGLSGGYTFILSEKHLISLAAQASGAQHSFDEGNLRWDNQFDGVMYNPVIASGESFDDKDFITFDLGFGLNYRWQQDSRTKIDVGGGWYHATNPDFEFYSSGQGEVPHRYTGYVMSQFQLADALDIMINGSAQFMNEAEEFVPAAILRLYLNRDRGKEFGLDLGAIYRFNTEASASIAPMIGLVGSNWNAAISYDIDLSDFEIATERYGGPEISFIYRITKVKPLENFKTCPIF